MATASLPSPLGQAALQYARRGWRVFPCREGDDSYVNGKGETVLLKAKAPYSGNGVKDATSDEDTIRGWWKRWPNAMIGLAMGDGGLFALDFDPRYDPETGEEFTLETLKAELEAIIGCELPTSLAARTPSGGVHVYLMQPADAGERLRNRVGTKKNNLPEHVDVRAAGGYVILPPSRCLGGEHSGAAEGAYRWLRGKHDAEVAAAPPSVVDLCRTRAKAEASGESTSSAERPAPRPPVPRPASIDDATFEELRKYAMRGLDGECQAVRNARSGARNAQLNESALKISSLVAAGVLDEAIARSSLEAAARANPGRDDDSQLLATINSGWTAGANSPRDLVEIAASIRDRLSRPRSRAGPRGGGRVAPSHAPAPHPANDADGSPPSQEGGSGDDDIEGGAGGDADRECAFLPQTDLGNAERFIKRMGRDFLYVKEWGWLAWDGRRWCRERADALVRRAVYKVVRAILDEAELIEQSGFKLDESIGPLFKDERDEESDRGLNFIAKWRGKTPVTFSETLGAWARASESAQRIKCIAELAQPLLTAQPGDFDADPLRINVANGTIVLLPPDQGYEAEARLLPHNRRDKITKLANVVYEPRAICPIYDGFLARVQPVADDRRFLHAWGGYNLTGDISAQKLVFNYGMGANGKSTWTDTVAFVAGDYAASVRIETFLDQGKGRKGGDATPDLAALAGRRMVRTSEPERGAKFADALIKLVTGGEPLTVRELNLPFFEMLVTFKITISGNHKPEIGNDHGIWRRMRLLPWIITIPEAERDDKLTEKLRGEASGILNHLIRGALDWLTNGLPESDSIREATQDYKEASDPLGRFLTLCVVGKAGGRVQSSTLYSLFKAWALWAGETEWSQKGFTKAMMDKGYLKKQSNTIQWLEIDVIRQESDFVDQVTGKPLTTDIASAEPEPPAASPFDERPWGEAEEDDPPL